MSRVLVPVKQFGGSGWGDLCAFSVTHEIVGEVVHKLDENFSFIGGHRVRRYRFKKNVHFKVPSGTRLDISAVAPEVTPRRNQR